jgi:glycosyltransferase involved in cell wall biosynthesis
VLTYVEALAEGGIAYELLSFEKAEESAGRAELSARLETLGIGWTSLVYHRRPSLPATLFDIAHGVVRSLAVMRRHRIALLHARSHVPAAIALAIKKLTGTPFVFDLRGLLAEEYADAGHWRAGGLKHRLVKWAEARILRNADAIIVLTDRFAADLRTWPVLHGRGTPIEVIPCCVDLSRFGPSPTSRASVRHELGLGERPVLVYSGSLGTWYLADEMARFFAHARAATPDLYLMVLTPSDPALIVAPLARHGVPASAYGVRKVAPGGVEAHLAAADAGLSFIMPSYSKTASSPTKIGEYLASGLPVVVNSGVGDLDRLRSHPDAAVVVESFSEQALEQAARTLAGLLAARPEAARASRALAAAWFDLRGIGQARYAGVYARLGVAPDGRRPAVAA